MIPLQELFAIALYVGILLTIGVWSFKGHQTASDFIIGKRSLNFWLTALSAHASDMSSWLFMAFPAVIFVEGLLNVWLAVGLILFMSLNWLLIAPRIRIKTEAYNSMTLSSFFESRFHDTSGLIRLFTALLSFIFYTIYISSGVVALGLLIEMLFGINYYIGISAGVILVVPYLLIGGYVTIAWLDFFQGIFLLLVIIIVPLFVLPKVGGFAGISEAFAARNLSLSLIPNYSTDTLLRIFLSVCGWGIGYFGQPHIITKFMGIKKVGDMRKSMAVGISWQTLALIASTFLGMLAVAFFKRGIDDPQLIFPTMVKEIFPPFIITFILCAVVAATISTMDSQILVLASSLTEDIYKRMFRKTASSKELLWTSRLCILLVTVVAYLIAFYKISTIYNLVYYAWSGLGSSFGPLLIFGLFSKKANKYGAWAGILTGGTISIVWPYVQDLTQTPIPSLIPGFLLSSLAICLVSFWTRHNHFQQRGTHTYEQN